MTYLETRRHELRKRRLLYVDGNLMANAQTAESGVSARLRQDGYWGFAASSASGTDVARRVADQARRNAAAMGRFGRRDDNPLPQDSYRGAHRFEGRPALSQKECLDRLAALDAWCKQRFPDLKSTRLMLQEEHHAKQVSNSLGSEVLNSIQRALCMVTFTAEGPEGQPVELFEAASAKGTLGDLALDIASWEPVLEDLYRHVRAKCEAVPARGGTQTVVLGPRLAGILAHEAMGHPCEADLVRAGAVTGSLVGQRVASELVTMVDVAHTFRGEEVMVPVYCDDEGMPARDAVLIRDGILTEFMHSRETAAELGLPATGNARAYTPSDEPLVRMRNTVILPGTSKLEDMIAGVDDGYYVLRTGNGQADATTEFMFGITLAYEIRGGKLGSAIRDTTLSGSAIKVLQSADAVSDDLYWTCAGYCGKKQPMVVSMGGPALRVRSHMGGDA